MCTPSGPEGAHQSGSHKVPSALGSGGAGARTRPGAQGEEPHPGSKTLPSQAGQQALGRGSWGSGHCPGSISSPGLCPPLQAACPHRAAPGLLAVSFPYIVLFGIRKGSAWSSWRQEGACSQGHLELSGEAGGMPQPKVPSRAREPAGAGGGLALSPNPAQVPTQNWRQTRHRGVQEGQPGHCTHGPSPSPLPEILLGHMPLGPLT